MTPRETFHIEILGPDAEADAKSDLGPPVRQRVSVRSPDLAGARERALHLFARARAPQHRESGAEAVRVIDGAGREVFYRSRFDAPEG